MALVIPGSRRASTSTTYSDASLHARCWLSPELKTHSRQTHLQW